MLRLILNSKKIIVKEGINSDNEILRDLGLEEVSLCDILPRHRKIQDDEINKECSICMSVYQSGEIIRKLKCGHLFHRKCIDRWLKKNENCPICRDNLV